MTPAAALRDIATRIAPHLPPPLRDEARAVMEDAARALDEWQQALEWESEIEQMCRAVTERAAERERETA